MLRRTSRHAVRVQCVFTSWLASRLEHDHATGSTWSSSDATPLPGNVCAVFSPEPGELLFLEMRRRAERFELENRNPTPTDGILK